MVALVGLVAGAGCGDHAATSGKGGGGGIGVGGGLGGASGSGSGGRGGGAAAGASQGTAGAQAGNGGSTPADAGTDGTVGGRCAPLRLGPTRYTVDSPLVDIDGDGRLDIVTIEMDGHSAIFLQNGTRSFADPVVYDFDKFQGRAIAAGDLNEDGAVDFVVSDEYGLAKLLLSTTTGGFSVTSIPIPGPGGTVYDIAIADFDGDGHRDLAFALGEKSQVGFLWASGPATFLPLMTFPTCPSPARLLNVDANEDQRPDLVVACVGGLTELYLNNGARTFASPFGLDGTSSVLAATSGDVNRDGHVDIVTADSKLARLNVLLGDGHGTFYIPGGPTMTARSSPMSAALGDLDHDGVIDLLVGYADDPRLMFYRGNGNGSFQLGQSIPTVWSVINLRVADIDRDGFDDILATNWGNGLTVYFGPCP